MILILIALMTLPLVFLSGLLPWLWNVPFSPGQTLSISTVQYGVTALAWSPDSTLIASVGDDRKLLNADGASGTQTLLVWDAHSRKVRFTTAPQSTLTSLAWSPDGKDIASAGSISQHDRIQQVRIWDARDGKAVQTLPMADSQVNALSWSPNSHYLAIAGDQVHIWNLSTGRSILNWSSVHLQQINALSWSPNGHYLAIGGTMLTEDEGLSSEKNAVWVLDASSGRIVFTRVGRSRDIDSTAISALAWSPDSRWIASANHVIISYTRGETQVTDDVSTIDVWQPIAHGQSISYAGDAHSLAWSPQGQQLVAAGLHGGLFSGLETCVFDAFTGKHFFCHSRSLEDWVSVVAWSPDGTLIASGDEHADGAVDVWSPQAAGQRIGQASLFEIYRGALIVLDLTLLVFLLMYASSRRNRPSLATLHPHSAQHRARRRASIAACVVLLPGMLFLAIIALAGIGAASLPIVQ
jgi:WD40 repeat protein